MRTNTTDETTTTLSPFPMSWSAGTNVIVFYRDEAMPGSAVEQWNAALALVVEAAVEEDRKVCPDRARQMRVVDARAQRICRICHRSADGPEAFTYNYGHEYAHTRCLDAERIGAPSPGPSKDGLATCPACHGHDSHLCGRCVGLGVEFVEEVADGSMTTLAVVLGRLRKIGDLAGRPIRPGP